MLKEEFVREPILVFADLEKPMRVKADASKFATGAALYMKTENGWKPCAYMSYKFNATEMNWTVYDKELFAIVKVFEG